MQLDLKAACPADTPARLSTRASTRTITTAQLDARLIDAWRRLGERALEANVYLTPMFVLPAITHADPGRELNIVLIEEAGGELIGLGLFSTVVLVPLFELRALNAYRSRHSYLTGLLVDRAQAPAAVDAFFDFVTRPGSCWHGIRFDWLCADNALGSLMLETACRRNIRWLETERVRRAIARPSADNPQALVQRIPAALMKDLRRRQRRLSEKGEVDWRIHCGNDVEDEVVERFLALEHMGWKGEGGSSLRANPAQEQFFKAMIAGFRSEGSVFFVELLVDGQVIASSCNLLSCYCAFAFKIGWNPDYARYSPGMLNELCLLERAGEVLGHLDLLESGAVEGSYIDKLWLDRQELVSGVFATTRTGWLLFSLAAIRRKLRQAVRALQQRLRDRLPRRPPRGEQVHAPGHELAGEGRA